MCVRGRQRVSWPGGKDERAATGLGPPLERAFISSGRPLALFDRSRAPQKSGGLPGYRRQCRAQPGGGSVAPEHREPRPLPASAGRFSRCLRDLPTASCLPDLRTARPVAQESG